MKTAINIAAIWLAIAIPSTALAQIEQRRPRRVETSYSLATSVTPVGSLAGERRTLESTTLRDGLQFYFEARQGGLSRLARLPGLPQAMTRLIAGGEASSPDEAEISAFIMRNLTTLNSSRIALAGYGGRGLVVLVETSDQEQAASLAEDMTALLKGRRDGPVATHSGDGLMAIGTRSLVELAIGTGEFRTTGDDEQFKNAQGLFANRDFFAYVDPGAMLLALTAESGPGSAYTAGAVEALKGMPDALAVGLDIEGDAIRASAVSLQSARKGNSAFDSLLSVLKAGTPGAAAFAPSDADLYVNAMIDWQGLFELIENFLGVLGAAVASSEGGASLPPEAFQGGDLLTLIETAFGFSIKNDLIPALGAELAISISGAGAIFDSVARAPARPAAAGTAGPPPRVLFIVEVKDRARVEQILTKLFGGQGGAPGLTRTVHRGAPIRYRRDFAFGFKDGFLLIGSSLAEIRKALDASAIGRSLAASARFREAMGPDTEGMLQVYVSGPALRGLADALGAGKVTGSGSTGAGLRMRTNPEGFVVDVLLPAELAVATISSLALSGSKSSVAGQPGRSEEEWNRRGGSRTPKLTTEDVRLRRR